MKNNRGHLLSKLERYKGFDALEETLRLRTIAFVQSNDKCFERTLLYGHVNGAAWVIDETHKYVLLTHHRKLDKWFQLGGHSDGEPDTFKVAFREAREESGLIGLSYNDEEIFDIDIHKIPARLNEPEHDHYDIRFLFFADRNEKLNITEESKELAWVDIDHVAQLNPDPSLARMVEKTKGLSK